MFAFTFAGTLAVLASAALGRILVDHFRIPLEYRTSARFVILLAGTSVAVSLIGGVFGGIVVGLQRFDLVNLVGVLTTGLRSIAIVIALAAAQGLVVLALIDLSFSLFGALAYAWLSFRCYPQLEIRFGLFSRQYLSLILTYGVYSLLLQLSTQLIYYSDVVVIGAFLPVGLVTFFAIAGSLVNYVRALVSGIGTTLTPMAGSLEAMNNTAELQRVTLIAARLGTAIALPICATFLLRGPSFIALWMGPQYAELSGKVLQILTLAMLFYMGNGSVGSVMLGISRHKVLVPLALGEGLCNLALSVILVRSMGVTGVAWGTTIPSLAAHLLFWPWYARPVLGIPVCRYLPVTWIRPGIAVLPFAVFSYFINRFWPAPNLFVFFAQVGAALLLYIPSFWYSCLSDSQRSDYLHGLVSAFSRVLRRI